MAYTSALEEKSKYISENQKSVRPIEQQMLKFGTDRYQYSLYRI